MNEPTPGAQQPGQDPAAAGNMMEGKGPQKEGQDPVIQALKTIQVAIAGLQEKGDPKAAGIMDAFQGLLQAFQGSPEKEGEAPQAPEQAPPAAKGANRPMVENQTKGAVPVM